MPGDLVRKASSIVGTKKDVFQKRQSVFDLQSAITSPDNIFDFKTDSSLKDFDVDDGDGF